MSDAVARVLSMTAMDSSQVGTTFITTEDVGGLPKGSIISAGTSVSDLIVRILGAEKPSDIVVYSGATDEIPDSISGLTRSTVKTDILFEGYEINIKAGNLEKPEGQRSQYVVFALPEEFVIKRWAVAGLAVDIPHTLVKDTVNNYNVYYLNTPSFDIDLGGNDYIITGGEK